MRPVHVAVLVAAFVVLVAGAVAAVLILRPGQPVAGGTGTAVASAAPAPSVAAPTSPPRTTTVTDPVTELSRRVAKDSTTAESLVGYWVPQVSSKALGTVDRAGTVYAHAEILGDLRSWQGRYPDAIVLRSDDYSSFRLPGFWVTVVPRQYATPDEANAWCDAEGLPADDCLAKRLSHTEPPAGNTVPR